MALNEVFHENLVNMLGKRTAYWLAQQTGISKSSAARMVAGELNPTLDTVEEIAEKAFNVSPVDMLKSLNKRKSTIPADILKMLEGQSDEFYDHIRKFLDLMLKAPRKK